MVKHLKDGQDFGPEHFPAAFGFTRSSVPERQSFARGGKVGYAEGGDVEAPPTRGAPSMARSHIHPHGHHVVEVEQMDDGSVVHHHEHGGHTIHHADGMISHHDPAGDEISGVPHMGVEGMHDTSEYAHRSRGGEAGDEAMVSKAKGFAKQVEKHEHAEMREEQSEGERDHKAFGGRPHMQRRGPPMMAPKPRTAPPSSPAGGSMGYGTQPSDEPGSASSGITQLSKGGRGRRG